MRNTMTTRTTSTSPAAPAIRPNSIATVITSELREQGRMVAPLVATNLIWLVKHAITVAFLGQLGDLHLAGGALAIMFANVTGFSVLTGLCGAMEPICGEAYGGKNFKLLRKTLVMATALLLVATLPISLLWLNVGNILPLFGQQEDLVAMAKPFLFHLLPDLIVTAFLHPLKAYLSAQGITVPIMLSSFIAVAFHVPLSMFWSHAKAVEGLATAIWATDLIVTLLLGFYVLLTEISESRQDRQVGGWWADQGLKEWLTLLGLCGPCCLTTCLEWWGYEILILLTGQLPNAKMEVGVLAIVLNLHYLLSSVMLSLSVAASTRLSNELGANQPKAAYESVCVSLVTATFSGCAGAVITVASRGWWGQLFSINTVVTTRVTKMMVLMAVIDVANFPLTVAVGITRATARPWLSTCSSLGGFYLLAIPLGSVLGFTAKLGLVGLLLGFLAGAAACLLSLLLSIARTNWVEEARKAQIRASC